MPLFLFQASRWQFISYLAKTIDDLTQQLSDPNNEDNDKIERKRDNLVRAAESGKSHITGPDVFTDTYGEAVTGLLDLTPVSRHDTLLSRRSQPIDEPLVERETVARPDDDQLEDFVDPGELADQHQRLRRKFIQRQGGFLKEDESPIQPLDEADEGKEPVSRFKAARLSRQ